ncbi:hypothetical protein KM043_009883 [Ampulex compressa]|nr:hypothetical protein KM043_009883 [Ampulex compressa]
MAVQYGSHGKSLSHERPKRESAWRKKEGRLVLADMQIEEVGVGRGPGTSRRYGFPGTRELIGRDEVQAAEEIREERKKAGWAGIIIRACRFLLPRRDSGWGNGLEDRKPDVSITERRAPIKRPVQVAGSGENARENAG